jgi:hypothetical protein
VRGNDIGLRLPGGLLNPGLTISNDKPLTCESYFTVGISSLEIYLSDSSIR